MFRTWVPKKIAGVRVPRKFRKAGARLPKPSRPMALAALGSATAAALVAGLRWGRRQSS